MWREMPQIATTTRSCRRGFCLAVSKPGKNITLKVYKGHSYRLRDQSDVIHADLLAFIGS